MSKSEFIKNAWNPENCNQNSWRGILCQNLGWTNLNFSSAGSSNQRQFRSARDYFSSRRFQKDRVAYDYIVVLWGITSTRRNEVFSLQDQKLKNFFYSDGSNFSKFYVSYCYDHDHEVWNLRQQIKHWDAFFSGIGIKNFWFDTFNTHNYKEHVQSTDCFPSRAEYESCAGMNWPDYADFQSGEYHVSLEIQNEINDIYDMIDTENKLPRLICGDQSPRDLASWLALQHGISNHTHSYHLSNWKVDNNCIEFLKEHGLINPFSLHPTRESHIMLVDFFIPHLI
jgi:hypothetical protein